MLKHQGILEASFMRRWRLMMTTSLVLTVFVVAGIYSTTDHFRPPTHESQQIAAASSDEECLPQLLDVAQFAAIEFGLPIEDFANLVPLTEKILPPRGTHLIQATMEWFQRTNDLTHISGVPVRGVYYGFLDDKLAEVVVMPSGGGQAGRSLLESLEHEYGGKRIDHETWIWVGDQTAIHYGGFCRLETSGISVVYIFPSDKAFRQLKVSRSKPIAVQLPPLEICSDLSYPEFRVREEY